MAQRLSELKLREVSLVDRPANASNGIPHAVVSLWKRDNSDETEFEKAVFNELVAKDGKTYAGTTFPKSDFAYTPTDTPSDWKLRLTKTPGGAPDVGIVGAACAALGPGFRGKKVQIPTEALAAVKAKVRAAWKKANEGKGEDEMPEAIRKGEDAMTLQEIEKRVGDQDTLIAKLTAESDLAKAETETVLKMSKKDRKMYASMPTDKRKEFMAADAEKRKGMLDDCAQQKKSKAAEDSMDEATKAEFQKAGPARRLVMLSDAEVKLTKAKGKAPKDDEEDPDEDDDEDEPEMKRMKAENKALTMKCATLEDQVNKIGSSVVEITKRERIAKFAAVAEKELPNTPGTPAQKGEDLMKMADAFGGETSEGYTKVLGVMKQADKALETNFQEIGKVGGGVLPALKVFEAKVDEIAKRDSVDKAHATEKAMSEAPDLYLAYEHDQRQLVNSR